MVIMGALNAKTYIPDTELLSYLHYHSSTVFCSKIMEEVPNMCNLYVYLCYICAMSAMLSVHPVSSFWHIFSYISYWILRNFHLVFCRA